MSRKKLDPIEQVLKATNSALADCDTSDLTQILSKIKIQLLELGSQLPKTKGPLKRKKATKLADTEEAVIDAEQIDLKSGFPEMTSL